MALGRAHTQRTPRRDVVFNVKHGSMVEKRRVPLAMASSACAREMMQRGVRGGDEAFDSIISTPRYLLFSLVHYC